MSDHERPTPPTPPTTNPADAEPVAPLPPDTGLAGLADALLKRPRGLIERFDRGNVSAIEWRLLGIALFGYVGYGVLVGSFSGGSQWWAGPLKVVAVGVGASAICLPSLYVFSALGMARVRLRHVVDLLLAQLALSSILLLGFLPVGWVFSQSTQSAAFMGMIHLGLGVTAISFGLRLLFAGFQLFEMQRGGYVRLWVMIFLITSLQLTTALRPILGEAETILPQEKKFFLMHWGESFARDIDG